MASLQNTAPDIWEDESNHPSPLTSAEFDACLEASNERLEQEIAAANLYNQELEALVARKEALVARLAAFLQETNQEREAIDARIAAIKAVVVTGPPRRKQMYTGLDKTNAAP